LDQNGAAVGRLSAGRDRPADMPESVQGSKSRSSFSRMTSANPIFGTVGERIGGSEYRRIGRKLPVETAIHEVSMKLTTLFKRRHAEPPIRLPHPLAYDLLKGSITTGPETSTHRKQHDSRSMKKPSFSHVFRRNNLAVESLRVAPSAGQTRSQHLFLAGLRCPSDQFQFVAIPLSFFQTHPDPFTGAIS
jgi:hypothetical protein